MPVSFIERLSRDKEKKFYSISLGRGKGQRLSTGIFTFVKPKTDIQRNHNKEALQILETKKSQLILDQQAIMSGYIPEHKKRSNFLEYYEKYVKDNPSISNRHLKNSFASFKKFLKSEGKGKYIQPVEVTEDLCKKFQTYLLKNYNGETPLGYFIRFKRVLKSAKKDGYFNENPAGNLKAKMGKNKSIKEIIVKEEYMQLMRTPCTNHEIKKAFIFSLYTGLRWADIKPLTWNQIKKNSIVVKQEKTRYMVEIPMHPIIKEMIGRPNEGLIFKLPTQDGANKPLNVWVKNAGIEKHITWHSARHAFSVLLQQEGVDVATVAGLLGHTSSKYVQQTYKRYTTDAAVAAIDKLPDFSGD